MNLSNYVQQNIDDNFIALCGDDGLISHFDIMTKTINNQVQTTIEIGWKYYCMTNWIKAGDNIRFKFDLTNPFKKCHVFKLN